jgi:arylsulfatase A-like enzyme
MNDTSLGSTDRIRVRAILLAALGFVCSVCTAGCTFKEEQAKDRFPNIVLVVLDTTRKDHCSAYGYWRDTTPHLREFTAQGVRFDLAYSPTATTAPTHATIFTSLYPVAHRVIKNGVNLQEYHQTLAEFLSAKGFETAAVVSSFVLDAKFGFEQGFSFYDDDLDPNESVWAPKVWEDHIIEGGFDRRADYTTHRVVRWLRERRDPARPFFLFVHYFDPHLPYQPPEPFRSRFGPAPPPGGQMDLEDTINQYDGEIAFTDQELGRLLDALRRMGLEEETLVLIASDHGEGLMQHGVLSHGPVIYEEAVRVPLLIRWPDHLPPGRVLSEPVEMVDLAPTIFDLIGVEPEGWTTHGQTLAAALRDEASLDPDRPIYLHRRHYDAGVIGRVKKIRVKGEMFGIRRGNWKYIIADELGTRELFDLKLDAGELRNVLFDYPDITARLASELEQWKRTHSRALPVQDDLSDEDIERLRSLGYVQ